MIANMFITFLNMSISGTLAAILLIVWRYASYKYIPSKFYYILWIVLMYRLMIPFNFKSVFSVLNLYENASDYSYGNKYVVTMEYLDYANIAGTNTGKISAIISAVAVIWLLVALFFIVQWLYVAFVTNRHLQYSVLYKDSNTLQIKTDVGVKRKINIYTSPNVVSPVIIGFLKPRIILPQKDNLSDDDKKYTIAHEMVHIKRFDYVLKTLFYFIASLHWFNLFVWYCFWLFNDDIELSCDQRVLHIYGIEHKHRYAYALYEHANRKNNFRLGYLSFARNRVAERIEKVMAYKKPGVIKIMLFTVTTLIIGLCSTTNPVFAAEYQYIPKTVYVNSTVRNAVNKFAADFETDIETNNVKEIIRKSTADSTFMAPFYTVFENSSIDLEMEKIFYTSQSSADVYLKVTANDGTIFPQGTERIVAQLDTNKAMGGLYAENLISYDRYDRINRIDHSEEAVMLVDKMIKFGLIDGSYTPQNAPKLVAFCTNIAYERGKDTDRTAIPQNEVEKIAKEFFLIDDYTNLRNTDYYDKNNEAYIYNASIGTHYEYGIVAFEKTKDKAVITVEFYLDPLQAQVDYTVKYTLKKV